jgi:hypothetical protein
VELRSSFPEAEGHGDVIMLWLRLAAATRLAALGNS